MLVSSPSVTTNFEVIGQNFGLATGMRLILKQFRNGEPTGTEETPFLTVDSSWYAHVGFTSYGDDSEWHVGGITGNVDGHFVVIWKP